MRNLRGADELANFNSVANLLPPAAARLYSHVNQQQSMLY